MTAPPARPSTPLCTSGPRYRPVLSPVAERSCCSRCATLTGPAGSWSFVGVPRGAPVQGPCRRKMGERTATIFIRPSNRVSRVFSRRHVRVRLCVCVCVDGGQGRFLSELGHSSPGVRGWRFRRPTGGGPVPRRSLETWVVRTLSRERGYKRGTPSVSSGLSGSQGGS